MKFAYKRRAKYSHQRPLNSYLLIFRSLRKIVRKRLAAITDFNRFQSISSLNVTSNTIYFINRA